MDPRIASGFSILGNALMPDPRDLAHAEVMRSQMLQNQAAAGKLTAETETIRRTQENLALLQDILSNQNSTAQDILSRSTGAGLTNDPSQLPGFALGSVALQDDEFDIDDPASFSRALQATGQAATYAATPSGFAADQARQAAQATAEDLTKQRGQNLESTDRRYDTDVDAQTSRDVQTMQGDIDLEVADIGRSTQLLMNARDNANQRLIEARNIAARTGDNRETLAAQKVLDDLDRQAAALKERLDRIQLTQSQKLQRDADMAELLTQQEGAGARAESTANIGATSAETVANIQADSAANVARIRAGGGAGGSPKISPEAWRNFRGNAAAALQEIAPDAIVMSEDGKSIAKIKGISEDDWLALGTAAFQLYPNNDPERTKFVTSVLKLKGSKFRFNKKVFDAYTMGLDGDEDDGSEDTPAVTGDTGVAAAPGVPELGTGAVEETRVDTRNNRKAYLENGYWFYVDDNTPVPGQ